jgi:hypothetical protein
MMPYTILATAAVTLLVIIIGTIWQLHTTNKRQQMLASICIDTVIALLIIQVVYAVLTFIFSVKQTAITIPVLFAIWMCIGLFLVQISHQHSDITWLIAQRKPVRNKVLYLLLQIIVCIAPFAVSLVILK